MRRSLHFLSPFLAALISATCVRGEVNIADAFVPPRVHWIEVQLPKDSIQSLWKAPRTYVRGTVKADGQTFYEVGIHLKGGSGSGEPLTRRPSLSIQFDKFRKSAKFHGLSKVLLNNSKQDETLFGSILAGWVFDAAGIPSPRKAHARLTFNGRDLGHYVLEEACDRTFLQRRFGVTDGDLLQGHYGKELPEGLTLTDDDPKVELPVEGMRQALGLKDPEQCFQSLRRFLNWDAFASYLAAEVLTDHSDGYALSVNNFRVEVHRKALDFHRRHQLCMARFYFLHPVPDLLPPSRLDLR